MKFVLATILLVGLTGVDSDDRVCKRVVCYYINGQDNYLAPDEIRSNLCSHIVLSFLTKDYQLITEMSHWKTDVIEELLKLKAESNVKILIALQNDELCDIFSNMCKSKAARNDFIKGLVDQLRDKGLDGVKIDEQFTGGKKEHFSALIQEMSEYFQKESQDKGKEKLILSVGIPTNINVLKSYYDLPSLSTHADMLDIGTYNFKPPDVINEPLHHSPLKSEDTSNKKTIEYVLKYVSEQEVNLTKINVGLSTMAFVYELNRNGTLYLLKSIAPYSKYCKKAISTSSESKKLDMERGLVIKENYRTKHEKYENQTFLDDSSDLMAKVKYTLDRGFTGVVIKALNYDDKNSTCPKKRSFPLIRAVRKSCGLS